jgi:eukaryotic-like serine/threonine-protein kinase
MLIGTTLFKQYQILEQIGSGGFGNTYRAIDTAFLTKPDRAIKHLCPNNTDPESIRIAKKLFETEAKVLESLGEHPQIPRFFAHFEENSEFFLAQEYIEGHNLTQEFQSQKRWSEAETIQFLQELLEILAFVHQNNTIHRDLKPANIMRRHQDGKLVLIDFGAVKEIIRGDSEARTVAIGTPVYSPREQLEGLPGKYSDVYAVGILGIQALTGLSSAQLPEYLNNVEQIWNNLNIEVNSQLKDFLERMVRDDYKQRFPDASEALKAITPTKIESEIESKIEPLKQKESHNKTLLSLLLGTIVIAGVGFFIFKFFSQPNYQQLETYLQNQQWQEANVETDKIMLKIAGENNALDAEDLAKFPCQNLRKIDKLWQDNSNQKFGFTPQKEAYLATGNEFERYTQSTYEAFGEQVQWRTFGVWSLYGDLQFTNLAPSGHLPTPGKVSSDSNDLRIREREMLLSRFDDCGL